MTTRSSNDKNVLRASILAINDGLCSNFNFVMGVLGTGISSHAIVITGVVGIIAGAFSMAMGEWLSLSTVNDKRIDAVKAALYSFCAFVIGASIPIIPFIFLGSEDAIVNVTVICGCAMFTIGVADGGKKTPIKSGIKHIIVGLLIAAVTHFICSFLSISI
jgi:VIT1/CCC1 family predicted Fe2+/Mn2+ transporter